MRVGWGLARALVSFLTFYGMNYVTEPTDARRWDLHQQSQQSDTEVK